MAMLMYRDVFYASFLDYAGYPPRVILYCNSKVGIRGSRSPLIRAVTSVKIQSALQSFPIPLRSAHIIILRLIQSRSFFNLSQATLHAFKFTGSSPPPASRSAPSIAATSSPVRKSSTMAAAKKRQSTESSSPKSPAKKMRPAPVEGDESGMAPLPEEMADTPLAKLQNATKEAAKVKVEDPSKDGFVVYWQR